MDCSDPCLDAPETQRSTGVSYDLESVPEDFLTNLTLSDLYNLHGEYVSMTPKIFSGMRAGNKELLEEMKGYETPMACLQSDTGDSILHLAAASCHLELVKNIVSECPCLLLEPNSKHQIPLHVAARAGHFLVVKVLVASVTYFSSKLPAKDRKRLNLFVLKDIDGDTPLHAALKDLFEKTALLMHHERTTDKLAMSHLIRHQLLRREYTFFKDESTRLAETSTYLVNTDKGASFLANEDGVSALYLATEAGNISVVNAILNLPHENLQSLLEGRKSIVHAALRAKNTDVLVAILKQDPSLIKDRDKEGRTCLSVGASMGYYEGVCKMLDQSTESVYQSNKDGSFPIHMAAEKGQVAIMKEILERCPDSIELINKQGQNILHIAAKNGKFQAICFIMKYIKERDENDNHLIEEQDVEGNTPLHLATINWCPRSAFRLSHFTMTNTKAMNIQNKDGQRPLDIAELNLQPDYIFRERLTLTILLCVYAPKGVGWLTTSGMTLKSKSEHLNVNRHKDHINALLLVAALVATVTFTAGFTLPGGFNSSSPNSGQAILAKDNYLFNFLVFDIVAMQCSIIAIVALIWAQLGDPAIVNKSFHFALPALYVALISMSFAFIYGLDATIHQNRSLYNFGSITCIFFTLLTVFLLTPYVIPQVPGIPILQSVTWAYLSILLIIFNEEDAENDLTYGSDYTCVTRLEDYVESSSAVDQVKKSKLS